MQCQPHEIARGGMRDDRHDRRMGELVQQRPKHFAIDINREIRASRREARAEFAPAGSKIFLLALQ